MDRPHSDKRRRNPAATVPENEAVGAADLHGVLALLAQIAGDARPLAARRQDLVRGLAGLIGAEIWYWVQSAGAGPDANPAVFAFLTGGWSSQEQQALIVTAHHAPAGHLINAYFQRRFGQHVTCLRRDVAPDDVWYGSELYRRHYQPAGVDDFLMSAYPLPGNMISGVGFYRSPAGGRFSPRDRALVHLVMDKVGWLHRGPTDLPASAAVPALSPRCREVLLHLLQGDSRKQIAAKLHRSDHTVAGFIKAVYHQLGVSSRGELMAQFLSGAPSTGARGIRSKNEPPA